MASASRALLLASLRPLPAYRVVRPLTAAGSFLPARSWLSPAVAAGPVRCFAARRATSSSSPREDTRLPSSRPPKETVLDVTDSDSDSEDTMISDDDDSEETAAAADDSDDDVAKSSGGSASEKTNCGRRPPKETRLRDGCDFKHWLVVMDPPPGDDPSNPDVPRDEIINGYIATLAQVVGSVEKARKKIYSVSTRHYFAFGACISEELSYKLKELPKVRWVLPDSYLDTEPFINGKAVPYDPKYHEYWVRHNARDHCSSYVRRDNMQNLQNRDVPTGRQILNSPPSVQQTVEPHDVPTVVHHAKGHMPPPSDPSPNNSDPPTSQHHVQSPQACDAPGSGQNSQQCGSALVHHQVDDNQDRRDNPGDENQGCPNNHDDNLHTCKANSYKSNNNGCQGECSSCYQNGSAAGQPHLHGANAPSHQGCYRGKTVNVHQYYNCHVHYHYYY